MLHPIFTVLLRNPELIVNHLAGYAQLMKVEVSAAGQNISKRIVSGIISVVSALLALIMLGVAVMLGVMHGSFNWILVVIPGMAATVAVICAVIASRPAQSNAFFDLRDQFRADVEAFNSLKEKNRGP